MESLGRGTFLVENLVDVLLVLLETVPLTLPSLLTYHKY